MKPNCVKRVRNEWIPFSIYLSLSLCLLLSIARFISDFLSSLTVSSWFRDEHTRKKWLTSSTILLASRTLTEIKIAYLLLGRALVAANEWNEWNWEAKTFIANKSTHSVQLFIRTFRCHPTCIRVIFAFNIIIFFTPKKYQKLVLSGLA